MHAPQIDPRTYQGIVAATEALAQQFSDWRPHADGQLDAGRALIGIFGRFAELIVERLNRVPEKNFLAFLNLIGTEMLPPQPARVPLTFHLAANSPIDPVVPAGTQIAAPPLEGEEEEVVFETDQDLIVTRSQVLAAFSYDPETDRYATRTLQVLGTLDEPFPVFRGDQPIAHQLYLACDALLSDAAGRTVSLNLYSPDSWQWETWPLRWEYWDGTVWQKLEVTSTMVAAEGWLQVTITPLPELVPSEVNDLEAGWLRAQLTLPLPPCRMGRAPASIAMGSANNPVDFSVPFDPFGATYTYWYLSAAEVFGQGGAIAVLDVTLDVAQGQPAATADLRLEWEYKTDLTTWASLGQSGPGNASLGDSAWDFNDETHAFTQDGLIRFRIPLAWGLEDHRSRRGRWLRVKIASGNYMTRPTIAGLTLGWEWALPRLRYITVSLEAAGAGGGSAAPAASSQLYPELGFTNTIPLDVSKDFYPFGAQPAFNDTFYVACEAALAQPGATVEMTVMLTNPPDRSGPIGAVKRDGNPVVTWEVSTGRPWQELRTSDAATPSLSLTNTGTVTFTLPATIAPTVVNGEEKHWLRARLIGGDYGEAAKYTGNATDGYTLTDATYAPPVVQSITFTVTKTDGPRGLTDTNAETQTAQPVSACFAYNDLAFVDYTAIAATADNEVFSPFTVMADTESALYLGLDRPFDARPFTLYLQVEPPRPEDVAADMLAAPDAQVAARVTWEYAGSEGWVPLGALDDTATLTQRGLVHFIGPRDFVPRVYAGQTLYWLRLRWHGGEFVFPPQLRRVALNTIWATQAATSRNEILGSSNGNPDQFFSTAQTPVLPGQQLEVREREMPSTAEQAALAALEGADAMTLTLDAAGQPDEIWVRWHAQSDLYASGPRDRHYTIDRLSGDIHFGNGHQGMIPPLGQNNIRMASYRYGGGARGNRTSATIIELKSSVPYIDSVINHEPSRGGAEQEALERVKERGPAGLRHRDRAVTAQDLEDLAYTATPEVARVRAIVPIFEPYQLWLDPGVTARDTSLHAQVNAGGGGLVVVPRSNDTQPTPSLSLLEQVRGYLLDRISATADLWVAGPEWVAVAVNATIIPTSLQTADAVVGSVRAALNRFLHPLTGGTHGRGWDFGAVPRRSDFHALIEALGDVDHVRTLSVTLTPVTARGEQEELQAWLQRTQRATTALSDEQRRLQDWVERSLIFSGTHDIHVVLETL